MCGIVGYIGSGSTVDVIYEGLKLLEYRGYDSAGIAVLGQGKIGVAKAQGKLANLTNSLGDLPSNAHLGIGHTRWATHGAPTTVNAHPHVVNGVALVHNGIIENYREVREKLERVGTKFNSQTDSEVALHQLVQFLESGDSMEAAICKLTQTLRGAFALGIFNEKDPDHVYVVKYGSPIAIGVSPNETVFASDVLPLLKYTRKVFFLNDREFAKISTKGMQVFNFEGNEVEPRWSYLEGTSGSADKQGFKHYMIKEIFEQPRVVSALTQKVLSSGKFNHDEKGTALNGIDLSKVRNIVVTACGTAYHAGMFGRYVLEDITKIPTYAELASELRYRKSLLDPSTLLIAVSQSGETADTLACVKFAREAGSQVLTICNVPYSSIPRASNATMFMEGGPEIGVASTKAFSGMILAFYLLANGIADSKGTLAKSDLEKICADLGKLPAQIDQALYEAESIQHIADKYYDSASCLFIGRGVNFPIALEGALKLKEISYIHAEGYAGGELKHGPIALIDKHMPVVAILADDPHFEKMLSNVEEVRARDGRIIAVGSGNDPRISAVSENIMRCPQIENSYLQPLLSVVPLQLFSYYVAVKRGTDVDQPRNLAKSVTVE